MSYFRYPLCMGNTRMCYKERHSLLLKYLITFLRYVRMIQGASDRILKPRMVHTVSFLPKITLKFRQNISFGAPSLHRKWDAVLQGETTIAAEVFHNLPPMYKDDCKSFWQHLQAPYEITVSFILKTTLQSHKNIRLWVPNSSEEMR